MKNKTIKTIDYAGEIELTTEKYVKKELNGFDYDSGQLETIQRTVDRLVDSYAKLIQTLHNKGVLTRSEIERII